MQVQNRKKIIGRIEKVDLPALNLNNLDAKIDTGAYTSSLHCHHIQIEQKEGERWVQFYVLDPDHPEYEKRPYKSRVHKIKKVKSSNGQVEERVVIKQAIRFCGENRQIQLSLTDRSEMKFPVLIGRRFLSGKYLVDVSSKFLNKPA